jgi:cytochrome c-type biogenesis protein CcmF
MMAQRIPATSPIEIVGTVVLLVAFVVAAWCVAAGIAGNVRKNRRLVLSAVYGLYGFFALIVLASALIIYGFVTHDYAIKYVAHNSDTSMSLSYKITALWGGLDGSLLFWVLILSIFSAIAVRLNQNRHRDMIGFVVATIMVVQLFFLALLIYVKNPYASFLTEPPKDGEGLNPLLQNYWMVIHPPSLYVGYVAATIPFAFGIGALASGRLDDLWLSSVRAWSLICFFFLSFGLILGGRWAYEELGWGGYWAWDPVENAGLFPWFTVVAFLHSIIIQEQRGMLKTWNIALVIISFMLTIFGTFMTRSGIVESVHAFGKDDQLALLFVLFMVVVAVVSFGLLIYRAPKLKTSSTFESFTSREFAFLLNNWVMLGCAAFVLFATMFPTISEAFAGKRVSVGIPFFNKFMVPLGLSLLLLAGIAPLLAWRRTTRERLYRQFLIPTSAMTAVVALSLVASYLHWTRDTRVLTPIFHGSLKLPMTLICFGLIAFTVASIAQEYVQGLRVRMKQTGSDPVTSLVGMILVKRRKYGGYIVHLGVAILFLGFAGKAWDSKQYFEVKQPAFEVLQAKQAAADQKAIETKSVAEKATLTAEELAPSTIYARDYKIVYWDLRQESDDNKHAVTAVIKLYHHNDFLETMYPAKWTFQTKDQTTSEVAIHPRITMEDFYIVLDHYDAETQTAVFVVYINPMINWVWLGIMVLLFGTLICLIPQALVDKVSFRPRTRLGRAADLGLLILLIGGMTMVSVANAQPGAPPGMEHADDQIPQKGHMDGGGYAATFRPEMAETPEAAKVAERLMKGLVCMCGGCNRENLHDCKCAFAADERRLVLAILQGRDLREGGARSAAYDDVIATFVKRYGGEDVLNEPSNQLSWIVPYVAIVGGLALVVVMGRRWVKRGRAAVVASDTTAAAAVAGDPDIEEEYAEKLDDELRDTD